MSADPVKPLYTLAEVASLLGVSREVVRRWVERGDLEAEWIGGRRYVPLSSLKARGRVWDSVLMSAAIQGGARRGAAGRGGPGQNDT